PTVVEIFIYLGTIGFFMTLFLVFAKVAPVIALAEVKSILKTAGDQYIGAGAKHGHHEEETSKPGHYETLIKPQ
ncbi:MAG: hypothetical protein ABR94_05150, partial [Sphingobacteriales bacterium BACL12 MAG-120802-bin5]